MSSMREVVALNLTGPVAPHIPLAFGSSASYCPELSSPDSYLEVHRGFRSQARRHERRHSAEKQGKAKRKRNNAGKSEARQRKA